MRRSKIFFLLIAIVISAGMSTALVVYLKNYRPNSTGQNITVMTIINYGSLKQDNLEEYNVSIASGSTALQVFSMVAELDLLNYSFGVYIKGVNGYTEQGSNYWAFYYFNHEEQLWVYSELGVSNYLVEPGDRVKLQYSN